MADNKDSDTFDVEKARQEFWDRWYGKDKAEVATAKRDAKPFAAYNVLSKQNGVTVYEGPTPDTRIIDLPDRYEVFAQFMNKRRLDEAPDSPVVPYAFMLKSDDIPKGTVRFVTMPGQLDTAQGTTDFQFKVNHARRVNLAIQSEMDKMKNEYSKTAPTGAPAEFKDGMPHSKGKALPYINETVLARGEYFTLVTSKSSETITAYRFIENHRFLKGSQEFAPKNRASVLAERLPVGEKLHFAIDGAKIQVRPYVAKERAEANEVTQPEKASEQTLQPRQRRAKSTALAI